MRIKVCLGLLVLCVLYLLLPLGEYGMNDVSAMYTDSRNSAFQSLKVDDFIYQTKSNTNPEIGYIVHPNVAMTRDGVISDIGVLTITSGHYRTGTLATGVAHAALDTTVQGVKNIGSCPALQGKDVCGDTVLISPISGTIERVVSLEGHEDEYFSKYQSADKNSEIRIKAKGALEGYYIRILHLAHIPDYIVEGYEIKQGEFIGAQCSLGLSTGSHVHMDVLNGEAPIHVNEWFKMLALHESIKDVNDTTGVTASKDLQGWVDEDIRVLKDRERYELDVLIPDDKRVGGK